MHEITKIARGGRIKPWRTDPVTGPRRTCSPTTTTTDLLFHEAIPCSGMDRGGVFTSHQILAVVAAERVPQCMDIRETLDVFGKRIHMVNQCSAWNHLQAQCQGSSLDLLRPVYEETQHQGHVGAQSEHLIGAGVRAVFFED